MYVPPPCIDALQKSVTLSGCPACTDTVVFGPVFVGSERIVAHGAEVYHVALSMWPKSRPEKLAVNVAIAPG